MANRSFIDSNFSLVKRMVHIFSTINVSGTTPTVMKWNYPQLGQGPSARTYTTAAAATALPSGAGPWPLQYQSGSEGVANVARTATGLYTLTMQDNYQRMVGLSAYSALAGGLAAFVSVAENTSISNYSANGGSLIGLAFLSSAGVAVDPVGQVRLMLVFADATEP